MPGEAPFSPRAPTEWQTPDDESHLVASTCTGAGIAVVTLALVLLITAAMQAGATVTVTRLLTGS
jgi:hypothetical protein